MPRHACRCRNAFILALMIFALMVARGPAMAAPTPDPAPAAQKAGPDEAAPAAKPAATDEVKTPAKDAKPAEAPPSDAKPAEMPRDQTGPAQTPANPAANPAANSPATPGPAAAPAPTATPDLAAPADSKQGDAGATKDPFGEKVTLSARNIVFIKASARWESAFETIVATLKRLSAELKKAGGKDAGPPLVIYTETDDAGFSFDLALPVDDMPAKLPEALTKGLSPTGEALKFVHRGSYDNMNDTYEAITNHLDAEKREAKDSFIEEYLTDPLTTAEDRLVVNIFVPLKDEH